MTNVVNCFYQGIFPSKVIPNYGLLVPRPTATISLLFHSALILADAYVKHLMCMMETSKAKNIRKGNLQTLFLYSSFQMIARMTLKYGAHLPVSIDFLKTSSPNLF